MYISKFTLSDGDEEFEGYTDGTLWNGWANVWFTREQVVEFLPAGYDPIFCEPRTPLNPHDYPILVLNNGRETEKFESYTFDLDDGTLGEFYCFEGWEFMEVVK